MVIQNQPIVWPGRPYPLGSTWDGEGVNFALFSEHAEAVELCLFDQAGRRELHRVRLKEHTDQVWHCYLPEARPGLIYGYRIHGTRRASRADPSRLANATTEIVRLSALRPPLLGMDAKGIERTPGATTRRGNEEHCAV